ncbi:MAG TPA: monooxygenase [Blastocatellia bacterium]|nr:monooxygenase [Blastocatellia bacterium]
MYPIPKINIGIIGGGIGGVAAAVALHQAGIHVTVYERAAQMREVGAGMMLWPNATRVLSKMGLLARLAAHCDSNTHFLVRTSSGKVLMKIALGDFDVPAICVRRADLLAALLSALPSEQILLGHEFRHLEQSGERVRIHFADGTSKEHDAVIGADGIRSRVRQTLFGKSDPIYRGYLIWRGVARYEGNAIEPGANSESWGAGKRFGILAIGEGKFTWYATLNTLADHSDSPDGRKSEIQKEFAGWHAPISNLVDATPDEEILKHLAYDNIPLRRWGVGRVTLLGDAAHPCTPNLGQGGCMALEDALVLAKCIVNHNSIQAGLRRYGSLRYSRTRHIQQRSLLMGHIGQWKNPLVVGGRRVVTNLLPARIFEHNLRRVYSYELPGS